jgi:hypothetical protein
VWRYDSKIVCLHGRRLSEQGATTCTCIFACMNWRWLGGVPAQTQVERSETPWRAFACVLMHSRDSLSVKWAAHEFCHHATCVAGNNVVVQSTHTHSHTHTHAHKKPLCVYIVDSTTIKHAQRYALQIEPCHVRSNYCHCKV